MAFEAFLCIIVSPRDEETSEWHLGSCLVWKHDYRISCFCFIVYSGWVVGQVSLSSYVFLYRRPMSKDEVW